MDTFLSAVLGEIASRSINFFINKSSKPKVLDVEDSMQRYLLRAQVIIDEATGRHITNSAMLQQLDMLKDAMYQGGYILDAFRYLCHNEKNTKDQVVSHSFSLSRVNSLKGIYSSKRKQRLSSTSNRKTQALEQLEDALQNLSCMILDVKELVVFMVTYPRLYCQPYSMHLLLGNCMFAGPALGLGRRGDRRGPRPEGGPTAVHADSHDVWAAQVSSRSQFILLCHI